MLSALLYLRLTSFRNWVRSRARRLRQPKYLIGAIVGFAYFYFFFFRALGGSQRPSSRRAAAAQALEVANAALPVDWLPAATAAGTLLLLVFITFMWVVPTQRAALGFSEPEISFLFPAPITRRSLIHFRLLSSQFRSLIGAAVMMLFTNRWSFLGGNALTHAIGWWFIFSALNLHFSGANFTLTRLADLGLPAWRRRSIFLAFVLGVIATTFVRLPAATRWPLATAEFSLEPLADWLVEVTSTAPLSGLLWPFKTVLGPFLAVDTPHFLLALVPALLVITAHYLWVVRSAVAFEDASVDYAQRRAARIEAWRSGERRLNHTPAKAREGPFRLAGIGRPEFAFLWKNLLSTWPYFTRRVFLICAGVIAVGCTWLGTQPLGRGFLPGLGAVVLAFSVYVIVVGPQFARQDIRRDLPRADLLKTYPLAGWQIVLGEMLTPVAILTGILWLALLTLALTLQPGRTALTWLRPELKFVVIIGVAVNLPALVSLQLLVPNAAALFFPGWFQTTRARGGGPEVVGQRMIFFFAQMLTMVLSVLPALLIGAIPFALAALLQQTGTGTLMFCSVAGAALTLAVLVGEVAAGVWLLGQRFEKLDLSAELQP